MKPAAPDAEELKHARARILRWLGYRARSLREAQRYLEQKGFAGPVAETVLAEMQEYRYLDDKRLAEECVLSCLRRGYGPLRARFDLRNRGVENSVIEAALSRHFSPEKDLQQATALLQKRATGDSSYRDEKWLRRQAAYLINRGFNRATVMKALQQFYGDSGGETLS